MEYYLAITNNDFTNFVGKCIELENIILSEITQTRKDIHGMYSLISGYYLPKLRIPMIQLTDYIRLNKKEGQSVDAANLLKKEKNNHRRQKEGGTWWEREGRGKTGWQNQVWQETGEKFRGPGK